MDFWCFGIGNSVDLGFLLQVFGLLFRMFVVGLIYLGGFSVLSLAYGFTVLNGVGVD